MITEKKTEKKLKINNKRLLEYIQANSSYEKILYLDLGVKVVRLICYSELFIPHIQKQLTYTLRESAKKYDTTIILWNEKHLDEIAKVEGLFLYETDSNKLADYVLSDTTIKTYDEETNSFFYGVKNLESEEFVKEGHIFVHIFNKILKSDNTALVHGACIGVNNNGVLFCARGQRGKSTLTVLSLLEGFEYVSDDYLILEKENNNLYAYPIYSIITLSPKMYNEMYDKLDGTRFISNNARKDKYVLNIANLHKQFRKKYPIKLCMSLEFTDDENPSIKECLASEKGQAITQLVHSTIIQMLDLYDSKAIKKLIEMVNGFRFYKIRLCKDIYKNVEFLRQFMKEYKND